MDMKHEICCVLALLFSLGCSDQSPDGAAVDPAVPDDGSHMTGDPAAPIDPLVCEQGLGAASCDCSSNNCGLNSPVIDGVYFSQLSLASTQRNSQGFRLERFASSVAQADGGGQYAPTEDLVVGTDFKLPVGHVMVLERDSKRTYVRLAEKWTTSNPETQTYWAQPSSQPVPWYRLEYTTPERLDQCPPGLPLDSCHVFTNLCPSHPLDDNWSTMQAFVYEGNSYTQQTIEVQSAPTTPSNATWFTIACPGSLPAKMLLTRRVNADSYGAGLKEQQAFADMWAGNYCGDGRVFTRPGWPLLIRTKVTPTWTLGSLDYTHSASFTAGEVASIDAVWNGDGAACLNTPRLDTVHPPLDAAPPPAGAASWYDSIQAHCLAVKGHTLPACTAGILPASWGSKGFVISVNPTP